MALSVLSNRRGSNGEPVTAVPAGPVGNRAIATLGLPELAKAIGRHGAERRGVFAGDGGINHQCGEDAFDLAADLLATPVGVVDQPIECVAEIRIRSSAHHDVDPACKAFKIMITIQIHSLSRAGDQTNDLLRSAMWRANRHVPGKLRGRAVGDQGV